MNPEAAMTESSDNTPRIASARPKMTRAVMRDRASRAVLLTACLSLIWTWIRQRAKPWVRRL